MGLLFLAVICAASAQTASWSAAGAVRDWGLHREWRIEIDCRHPAAPARLVEVPWSTPMAKPERGTARRQAEAGRRGDGSAPLVRAGRRVILVRQDGEAAIRLTGTALESGRRGETVWVRAGLDGATLRGVVRGAGWVELMPPEYGAGVRRWEEK